jgi:hypothetical protein
MIYAKKILWDFNCQHKHVYDYRIKVFNSWLIGWLISKYSITKTMHMEPYVFLEHIRRSLKNSFFIWTPQISQQLIFFVPLYFYHIIYFFLSQGVNMVMDPLKVHKIIFLKNNAHDS